MNSEVTNKVKAFEQCFSMVLFIMRSKVIKNFESVDEMKSYH